LKVDFVDVYGRKVGLSYEAILARIRKEFPRARTTMGALRYERYFLYRVKPQTRLPARHRSRKVLAREYARSLLMHGAGISYKTIGNKTVGKFGAGLITMRILNSLEKGLIRENFKVPHRA
jgi:hypothetical protein